jgi:hypothetical protein
MRIASRSGWFGRSLVCGALSAVWLAAGCGKPSAPPAQFIGTWIAPPPGAELKPGAYPTLTLAPDGTGVYTPYPAPHPIDVNWVLKADKLVMANRDGSGSTTCSYRFNNKDELVIVTEGGEVTYRRYSGEEAAATPRAAAPSPTTGESGRPPARSRR